MLHLADVFGVNPNVSLHSYVDRGGLDERLKYALRSQRHIIIHGDSKQGKSWLRRRLLDDKASLLVQCVSSTTPEWIFVMALSQLNIGATLSRTTENGLTGQLDFSANAGFYKLLAGKFGASGGRSRTRTTVDQPFGQSVDDLRWVAGAIRESKRRLVIEDFHYLPVPGRRVLADWMKALGEYGVFVIIVGVWSERGLLETYNRDLQDRVEDVGLAWSDDELRSVLTNGSRALNIEMAAKLQTDLVDASYGNVGLLQALAAGVCLEEGVVESQRRVKLIDGSASFQRATRDLVEIRAAGFRGFVDSFRGRPKTTELYWEIIRALLSFDDEEVIEGVAARDLLDQVEANCPGAYPQASKKRALSSLERLQERAGVRPLIISYSSERDRVWVADRSLLFFNKFGGARFWPWNRSEGTTERFFP